MTNSAILNVNNGFITMIKG